MNEKEMTLEAFREYIESLPENIIIRVTVMEGEDGTEESKTV